MRGYLVLFLVVNLVLSSFYLDRLENAITCSRVLPVVTFAESGKWRIDKYEHKTIDKAFVGGHYYSEKAPLPALVMAPIYWTLSHTGLIDKVNDSLYNKQVYALSAFVCGVIPFLILLGFTFKIAWEKGNFFAPAATMLAFYSTFPFVYAGSFYGHVFAAVLVTFAYIFLKRKQYLAAGILTGAAFISEYTLVFLLILWPVQVWLKERSVKPVKNFLFGLTPFLGVILLYNFLITGSPFTMTYNFVTEEFGDPANRPLYGIRGPDLKALMNLLFTDYRGFFFYTPVLTAFAGLILWRWQKNEVTFSFGKIFSHYLVPFSIAVILFISSHQVWEGGWSFGPRHFIILALPWLHELVTRYNGVHTRVFSAFAIFGLVITLAAKVTVLYSFPAERNPFGDVLFPKVFGGEFNPDNLLSVFFGIHSGWAALIFILMLIAGIVGLQKIFEKRFLTVKSVPVPKKEPSHISIPENIVTPD